MQCTVKSLVYYEHHPNDFVIEHSHHCYECVFYMNGSGTISVEKEVYSYEGPTLTLICPGIAHDEKTNQNSNLYIVLFDVDDTDVIKTFNMFSLDEKTAEELKALFERMREEEKDKQPYYQEMISSLFTTIVCNYTRQLEKRKISSNKELVERTKTYIKENYKQNIDFEMIAYNIGYSFDRFRHIFKNETGVSIHQYLLNCRLYAAKKLLLQPNITIKEVAKGCGFDSVVHFNNFFKSKMNISPFQFKKSSKQLIDEGVFKIENSQNKSIILDTDIGGDCDDAGAIALANIFYNHNKIDILAMTFTTSAIYGPACIDTINNFYGNDFEIGATTRKDFCDNPNRFQEVLATEFDNRIYNKLTKKLNPVMDAVKLIRKKLAESENASVTIVCIGQLNNMSDLLDSKEDEFSNLSGVELVKEKVKEFVVMGGMFPQNSDPIYFEGHEYKSEYNIVCDLKSSQNFVRKCPSKIYFVDFLCGYKIKTGASLFNQNNERNPVTIAYRIFTNKPRESWDPLTIWFATFGKCNFFKISNEGKVNILDDGVTEFNESEKCGHYYLKLNNSTEFIAEKIDAMLIKEN